MAGLGWKTWSTGDTVTAKTDKSQREGKEEDPRITAAKDQITSWENCLKANEKRTDEAALQITHNAQQQIKLLKDCFHLQWPCIGTMPGGLYPQTMITTYNFRKGSPLSPPAQITTMTIKAGLAPSRIQQQEGWRGIKLNVLVYTKRAMSWFHHKSYNGYSFTDNSINKQDAWKAGFSQTIGS